MNKKSIIALVLIVIFIICFTLIYFNYIRDWRCKANLDTKTIETIAAKVNDSDYKFDEFAEVVKQLKNKYEDMGYEVFYEDVSGATEVDISNLFNHDSQYNDTVHLYFIQNNKNAASSVSYSAYTPYSNMRSYKRFLNHEYGYFRPVFNYFCSKQRTSDYKYHFTPFCWQKGEYLLAEGLEADCYGIMIFKNYTISIYYESYDIEHYNNFNSFLKNLSDSMS